MVVDPINYCGMVWEPQTTQIYKRKMKYNPRENPLKLQEIHLKKGVKVIVSWKRKLKCKCGKECWEAVRLKDKKKILIELVGLAVWDVHLC